MWHQHVPFVFSNAYDKWNIKIMLSYRHGYHAGNFADVLKHVVISLILKHLQKKEKPFCYLDTHAAAGMYDLQSEFAQKNREYINGITAVISLSDIPEILESYTSVIKELNHNEKSLRYYPGSPTIAKSFMRPQDRMILCELHNTEIKNLKAEFRGNKQVAVHHIDAYQSLKAFLPPKENRGMVLIDPAFDHKDELTNFIQGIQFAARRWPNGIISAWFPMQTKHFEQKIYRVLKNADIRNILTVELSVLSDSGPRTLFGCGMVIINPPWKLDEELNTVIPWLWNTMSIDSQGSYKVDYLVPE